MSRSRNPPPRGQGAARAKQMGLLLDLTPGGGMEEEGNDEELEAELLGLMGGGGEGGGGGRSQGRKGDGRGPVAMADIQKMAALCMKDLDDEEIGDEDMDDEDLLAELNEVLEDDEDETPAPAPPSLTPPAPRGRVPSSPAAPGASGPESVLLERIQMYTTALSNAKAGGESSKVRRYDRGLKTLQSMLTSVRKGKAVSEEDMPPPVALGSAQPGGPAEPAEPSQPAEPAFTPPPLTNNKPQRETPPPPAVNTKPTHLNVPRLPAGLHIDTPNISPLTPGPTQPRHPDVRDEVLSRQREYKIAAIEAKQSGDIEQAKDLYITAKKLNSLLEALDKNEKVDLSSLPPPPENVLAEHTAPPQSSSQPAAPPPAAPPSAAPPAQTQTPTADLPAPTSVAEALQQRMEIYKSAAEVAKSKGDDRKARMHQRIIKQYQDSIRAHKGGRAVSLSDLPVPPGCPPLQGSEGQQQNFIGVLETAMKIANQDADAEEEEDEGGAKDVATPSGRPAPHKAKSPAAPGGPAPRLGPKAQQQLDFLLLRRQAFLRAALNSKHKKDMSGAAQHLRNSKGLDPMINAAKSGLPVDITKIPVAPVGEEDYSLVRSRSSPRSSEKYHGLMELLRKQHEKCLDFSQKFTTIGNVSEALKYEKLCGECVKSIEVLKEAYNKGHNIPKVHTQERTLNSVKNFTNLTPTELVLYIIRGINLPPPSGVSANDLDASVKFEFPFPSTEEAQRDKTNTVKNSSSPEFKEQFKLNINRNHRGFKRLVLSKGIKFEILHKGGLFKTDRVVGTANLKLEALENHCEIREIIEVMDGRKSTGGKLEVRVKIRDPLSGVDLQPVTEKWLILEPSSSPSPSSSSSSSSLSPAEKPRERAPSPRSKPRHEASSRSSSSPPQYKLHSFSLLNYDRERLEWKLSEYRKSRRDPPSDLVHQHKEVTHRLQWQKSQLERAPPALLTEYETVLHRFVQGLSESVKKHSSQGNRDAAKDALGRMKMVENELESLRRKRTG